MEQMTIKEKKGLSPVWLLPIVALCIGGWLLLRGIQDQGVNIIVYFDDASGVSQGKTQVIYKGIPVGLVQKVEIDRELKRVVAHIEMVKESEGRLVDDMKFWIVKPEVSADKIVGLDTLVGGSYIGVLPGQSKQSARIFEGLSTPPPLPADTPGLRLKLLAHDSGSLSVSSPVYYKKIKVGEVVSVDFTEKRDQVQIGVLIFKEFGNLVNGSTVFWNMSGVNFDASLNRVRLRLGTLSTLLSGGIAFDSIPDESKVDQGVEFVLYESQQEAKLSRGMKLVLHFKDIDSVNVGTPLRYKGVDVGEVVNVKLDDGYTSLTAEAYAFKAAKELFREETYIWLATAKFSLGGVENVSTVIRGPYINIEPGNGKQQSDFDVQGTAPVKKIYDNGLTIIIEADRPDSLSLGSPVYYRKVQVGTILHIELAPDARRVTMIVGIDQYYSALIRDNTIFWNASGVRVNGGLLKDIKISTESMTALFTGGISLAIPEEDPGEPVGSGHVFSLLVEPTSGWETWHPEIWLNGAVPVADEQPVKDKKLQE